MCDKVILENGGILMFIPDCYKNQRMYNKAVDTYQQRANSNSQE